MTGLSHPLRRVPRLMSNHYRAWRAVSPNDGTVSWVVVDDDLAFHAEGCAFLTGLRARDRSPHTERVYAGRVALLLSWCSTEGVAWNEPRVDHLVRF